MISKSKYNVAAITIISAIMMFFIMLPSMLQNHGIFIIRGDYVDQYIPRLIKAKEILSSGGASWDWFNFLGSSYNKIDVLFSLNSICLLFPSEIIPYAVTYIHLIRIALIAMISYLYFEYMLKENKTATLGTLLYTFSSYTFMSFEFMQFLEALWSFPLLLLATEKMFREKNYKHQLIISVFLSCTISFYFFVFSTLLFTMYFLCRFFLSDEWAEKRKVKYFLCAVLEYLIGFLCAFFVFAPFIYKLFTSSGSVDAIGDSSIFLYSIVDRGFLARIFSFFTPAASNRFNAFGYSAWSTRATYIPVFSISFVLAFLLTPKNKKWLKVLCIAGVLCILIPVLSMVFNLFTSRYTRFAYGIILFLTLATLYFIENYNEKTARKCVYFTLLCYILLLLAYYTIDYIFGENKLFYDILHGFKHEADTEKKMRIFTLISSALMYVCLLGFVHFNAVRKYIIPLAVCVITIYGCSYVTINLEGTHLLDYYPETNVDLKEQVDKYFIKKPTIDDTETFRIDSSKQWRNYAYTMKQPSIGIFESVRNKHSNKMAKYIGITTEKVYVLPNTYENSTRTLLGVKYYYDISPKDNLSIPDGFSYLKTENGIDIYQNDHFIGMGFSYDNYMSRSEFENVSKAGENYADLMLNTLIVEDEDVDFVSDVIKHYNACDIHTKRSSLENFEITSSGFTATFESPEEQIIYISVPYENNGWTATINNRNVSFIKANIGCMAVKTERGKNIISFNYKSPSTIYGIFISAFGWFVLGIYLLIYKKRKECKKL